MKQWHELLAKVLTTGQKRPDRTGVGTLSTFGERIKFDLTKGFPAVTTKKLHFGQVTAELECFLKAFKNLESFHSTGCTIWDGNAKAPYWQPKIPGDLGRIYGVQWREWQGLNSTGFPVIIDQLKALIQGLKTDPYGRRHIITAWQPAELDQMCLPPCHILFQCYVSGRSLNMTVYMRSVDLFLGLPFDIASYAVLLHLIAKETTLVPGELVFFFGDAHIYLNHIDQVHEVLRRPSFQLPQLEIPTDISIGNPDLSKVVLTNYQSHPSIQAPLNI